MRTAFVITLALLLSSAAHAATIKFSGEISPDSMNKLVSKAAAAYGTGDRNITIEIDSDGGNLGAALNAVTKLKTYGVNTSVKSNCASSCTALYTAGKVRSASGGAEFMFHAVSVEKNSDKYLRDPKTNKVLRDPKTNDKLQDPNWKSASELAALYAWRWIAAVRSASPSLASTLEKNRTLLVKHDSENSGVTYSGNSLRKTGYVND